LANIGYTYETVDFPRGSASLASDDAGLMAVVEAFKRANTSGRKAVHTLLVVGSGDDRLAKERATSIAKPLRSRRRQGCSHARG
jgi:hypothetical protein